MKDALTAHIEGLKAAVEAEVTASTRQSIRRLARSLAPVAEASGAPDIAERARRALVATDAALEQAVRDLLEHVEVAHSPPIRSDLEVLLVEDDRTVATMVHALLKKQARRVHVASTAREAEALLATHPIDVLVLDLVLPDRDGRDLIVQLRENPFFAGLPIVVMSGQTGAVASAECLAVGANEFLLKPPDPKALRAAIARHTANARGAAAAMTAAPPPTTVAPTHSGPTRVLVVEDDRVTATLIKHRLVREGLEVTDFANGEDAFRWAESAVFDLAVLDVKVPGMDGFELLARLRQIPRHARVPIVMLTGLAGESDVVRGLELGATDYMVKPFSPTELLARIRRWVPTANSSAERPVGAGAR